MTPVMGVMYELHGFSGQVVTGLTLGFGWGNIKSIERLNRQAREERKEVLQVELTQNKKSANDH